MRDPKRDGLIFQAYAEFPHHNPMAAPLRPVFYNTLMLRDMATPARKEDMVKYEAKNL
jgi:hypothetical protein